MTKLRPCPFCGGEAELGLSIAFCKKCGVQTDFYDNTSEIIRAWNNRPNPWHTGTPTEEGDYLVRVRVNGNKDTDFYQIMELNDFLGYLKGQDKFYAGGFYKVLAWQKITPYEGEVTNG